MTIFIEYPKCSTCRNAKKFLKDNNVSFSDRDITLNNPTKEELKLWISKSGLELKKFFNTSGKLYRELELKDKIKTMTEDELLDILSSNGMIVKRPLLITDDKVLVGFKEESYKELV